MRWTFLRSTAPKRSISTSHRLTVGAVGFAVSIAHAFAEPGVAQLETPFSGGELPERKPGLWRITTISPKIGMQVGEACIESGDSIIGTLGDNCRVDVTRASDEVIVKITCNDDGGREVTSILFTGDFQNWYRGQSKTSSSAQEGKPSRHSGFTIEAHYLRDSCSSARN